MREVLLVDKTDLQALYLHGTYCHKTGTRPLDVRNLDKGHQMPPKKRPREEEG